MSIQTEVSARAIHVMSVVAPRLAKKMTNFSVRLGAVASGYPLLTDWHPVIPGGWGHFPRVPIKRAEIYHGNETTWAYSHHPSIVKFCDRYVTAWSNGFRHEDYPGQEVHFAKSADGLAWSHPDVLAQTPADSRMVRFCSGMYASNERLYCYVGVAKDFERDKAPPGMSVLKEHHIHLDVFETSDLKSWTHHENISQNAVVFEGPRETRGGRLMCAGFDCYSRTAMILIWDNPRRASDPPRIVELPASTEGILPLEETWYQTDDGRIWLYCRDGNLWGGLGLSCSDDEGDTWSDFVRTDFPNSSSLAHAGRLHDGRYYIVGNNYDRFLDRMSLQIALSDDGRMFDRQYTLLEEPTTRRIEGRHKENGYHYPNCCVDGDKLIVVYSINKEDVEAGVVDMSRVQ